MQNPLILYDKIFISQFKKCAIFQLNNGKIFWASQNEIRELSYSKIVDESKGMIRFYNIERGSKKWGVIHVSGEELIPPVYDYISPIIADDFFKVYIGKYIWEHDEITSHLFYEYIDTNSWNGDEYKGTLKDGKWGLVNSKHKNIIPIEYEWIQLIDDQVAICNVGGNLIKWFDGDEKEITLTIVNGLWKAIYLSDTLKIESALGNYVEAIRSFEDVYPKRFVGQVNYIFQAHNWQSIGRIDTKNNIT